MMSPSKEKLRGTLSLPAAVMVGLGSIIGGSVFATMGPAVEGAGGAAPLAFVAGAAPAYLTAYSYVRLVRRYPAAGGTVAYFNAAFGGGYLSASLNLMLIVCYACVASLYAGVFGTYLVKLFGSSSPMLERLASCMGVFVVAGMSLSSAPWVRRLGSRFDIAKFLVLGVFIAAALVSPVWSWENFDFSKWRPLESIATTSTTIFMSYQGFELIAAVKRPFRDERRALPWAFGFCLGLVTLYYASMAFCAVGNTDYDRVSLESRYLLSAVAERFMGAGGGMLLCLGALLASCSALRSDVFSVSQIPEDMAERHEMPPFFEPSGRGGRSGSILFFCSLLLIFVGLASVAELTAISSLGFLVVYAIVNVVSLRNTENTAFSRTMSLGGALLCVTAAGVLIERLAASPNASIVLSVSGAMLLLPFVWQAGYYLARRLLS